MRSGLSAGDLDPAVRPQDDLFGYVNGRWIASTPMPEDRARYGVFDVVAEQAEENLRELLDEAAEGCRDGPVDGLEPGCLAGALYASMLDEERAEALGLDPIADDLVAIDATTDPAELFMLMGRLARGGVASAVTPWVATDDRDSEHYVVYLHQGGLGLPDESYYHDEAHRDMRPRYLAYLERMFALLGRPDPKTEAVQAFSLETRLAAGHWTRVQTRDSVKAYTKLTLTELEELAPLVPWRRWGAALGAPDGALDGVIARQPSYLQVLSTAIAASPMEQWRAWARAQLARAYAPYLNATMVEADFDFYGRTLTGAPAPRDRWKRAIALVDLLAGEAAGQLYVARYFPPQAKDRISALVTNLVEAYRRDIAELAWMSPATREKALTKLDAFTPKVGYPDRWRDYSGFAARSDDLVGNVRRGYAFDLDRDWAKLGGPIDRGEWLISPQTVNAYYHSGLNEIVFPAAILQPPFFDVEADDAVNYGGIGSVIGHEIGHGFDDQGSKYDGRGTLVDWWTDADRAAFDALAAKLISQYDAFHPREVPDVHVNGALTVGENIGDLGGVTIAHLAYQIALDGAAAPELDGLTAAQRFFAGWAQIWRQQVREPEVRRLITVDPHSPNEFRANIVRNLPEFHEAFGVRPRDGLWLDEGDRVRIW